MDACAPRTRGPHGGDLSQRLVQAVEAAQLLSSTLPLAVARFDASYPLLMAIPHLLRATLPVGGLALAPRVVAAAECVIAREGVRCRCSPIPTVGDSASAPAMARAYGVAVRARVLPGRHWNERRLQVLERFLGPALDTLWLVQRFSEIPFRRPDSARQAEGAAAPTPAHRTVPQAAPRPAPHTSPRPGTRANPRVTSQAHPAPVAIPAPVRPETITVSTCDARLPAEGLEVLVLARQMSPGVLGVFQCSGLMVPVAAAEAMLRGLRAARPESPEPAGAP